ncbi:MAG TPA: serine hydrolase [Ohtaekwangia sp.]|uniref:serine hydrolase n=1 Tax=Ohtaekwangia sp. TaxID=2066019 RepID=UPI002F951892
MLKRILCLLAFSTGITFGQSKPSVYADAFTLLDEWFKAQTEFDNLPGISVGVVKDQQLIWSHGYGKADIAKNIPAQPNTIYSICSISKLFTSVAIMQLRDAGKLRLDDEVSALLPWFNIKQLPDSGPITVRMLLTHSSGLPRESDFPYWSDSNFPSKEQVIAKLGDQKAIYPTSTYLQYSNLGMSLLGYIVEQVSGVSYEQYINDNILKPLRLADTRTYFPQELWHGRMATGYSDASRKGERRMLDKFDTKGITPAAGYTSTVEDLARFASWQFRLLEKGGTEILKASTLREMHNVQYMDQNWRTSWGLGFTVAQVEGKTFVSHGGFCPGYQTLLQINPKDKLAFIVMINAIGTDPNKYFEAMRSIVAKATDDKIDEKKENDLEQYCGLYGFKPWGGEMIVSTWGDKLALLYMPNDNPKNMVLASRVKDDTFRRVRDDGALGEEITFERNKAGKIIKIWRSSNYRLKLK